MKKASISLALLLATALAIVAAAFASAGGKAAPTASSTALASCKSPTIGLAAPITGPAASIGEEQLHWALFEVARYNSQHKTHIKMIQGDTQLPNTAQATLVGQQFASDSRILGVVGPAGSQEVLAVGTTFKHAHMPYVSMSATGVELTNGTRPSFFRVVPSDAVQGLTDGNYMANQLKTKKVVIIDDQTTYSTGLAASTKKALEAKGVTVASQSVSQQQSDFSSLITGIAGDTDVVFLPWQLAAKAQVFGQQLQAQGKRAIIFGSDGLFGPAEFYIEGSYISTFGPDIHEVAEDAGIVKAYEAKYGKFGTFGPPAYLATQVMLDAVNNACKDGKATRAEVVGWMRKTNLKSTILGTPLSFTKLGDVNGGNFYIYRVEAGRYHYKRVK